MLKKNFYIGFENSGDKCNEDEFFNTKAIKMLKAEFIVHHHRPKKSIDDEIEIAKNMTRRCEEQNIFLLYNNECGNWSKEIVSPDGYDWVSHPDGCHYFDFHPDVLKAYASSPAFWGVVYDEAEHSQIHRNMSIRIKDFNADLPAFAETTGMTHKQADQAIFNKAKEIANKHKDCNAPMVICEAVFPVLFHNFSKAGFTIAYKQMKEHWSNLWAACAVGAARQYNKELWSCIDLWCGMNYPGHSPKELKANLIFAYLFGVDKAYIENIGSDCFYSVKQDGNLELKEYGVEYLDFINCFLPKHPRNYTHRDYEPEIAIIRFDDTDWGQGNGFFFIEGELFGSHTLKSDEKTTEWIKAWHTITHGVVSSASMSMNAGVEIGDDDEVSHHSFAPFNSPIVYDDTVTEEHLKTLSLAFLCGLFISENTLKDISNLVKNNGLTVVTSNRFAPKAFADKYKEGTIACQEGKGKWIITDDMSSNELKELIKPLLGKPDEISCRFKQKTVKLKIKENGDSLELIET